MEDDLADATDDRDVREERPGGARVTEPDYDGELRRTQVLLLLLSKLESNQKIIFGVPMLVQRNSFYDYCKRKFYREDSHSNLEDFRRLNTTLRRLLEAPLTLNKREYLINDITEAMKGIRNLYTTYNHDPVFCSELMLILRDTATLLEEAKKVNKAPSSY